MRKICVLLIFCMLGLFATNNISAKDSAKVDSLKNFSSNEITPYVDDYDCIGAIMLWGFAVAEWQSAQPGTPQEADAALMVDFYGEQLNMHCGGM